METTTRYHASGLRHVLRDQGRSARWLAQQVGVSETLLSHAMYGRKTIGYDAARAISQILDVDFVLLFELPEVSKSEVVRQEAHVA